MILHSCYPLYQITVWLSAGHMRVSCDRLSACLISHDNTH